MSPAVPADQLIVWQPHQHEPGATAQQREYWLDGTVWYAGNCLKRTAPGDRAAIYETGGGVIGFWDFSGYACPVPRQQGAYMAPGFLRMLASPVPRDELVKEDVIPAGRVVRKGLPDAAATRLEALLTEQREPAPSFVRFWLPADLERSPQAPEGGWIKKGKRWLNESSLETHVAERRGLWTKLGYRQTPQRQIWITATDRVDLHGEGERIITEVKQGASVADIAQLQRYLVAQLKRTGKPWAGRLLSGKSVGRALISKVESTTDLDLELWVLVRGGRLQRVAQSRR